MEAIGAIGPENYENFLKNLEISDKDIEVRETAHLAHERLKFFNEHKNEKSLWENEFGSGNFNFYEISEKKNHFLVDPTPPSGEIDIEKLKVNLMDKRLSLFDRYRAMFSLRNLVKVDTNVQFSFFLIFIFFNLHFYYNFHFVLIFIFFNFHFFQFSFLFQFFLILCYF